MAEKCENCGRTIDASETPMVWRDRLVCAGCHKTLRTANAYKEDSQEPEPWPSVAPPTAPTREIAATIVPADAPPEKKPWWQPELRIGSGAMGCVPAAFGWVLIIIGSLCLLSDLNSYYLAAQNGISFLQAPTYYLGLILDFMPIFAGIMILGFASLARELHKGGNLRSL